MWWYCWKNREREISPWLAICFVSAVGNRRQFFQFGLISKKKAMLWLSVARRRGLVNERGGFLMTTQKETAKSFVCWLLKPQAGVGQVVRRVNKAPIRCCCIRCSWMRAAEFRKQELGERTEIPGVHADLRAKASLHSALRLLHGCLAQAWTLLWHSLSYSI